MENEINVVENSFWKKSLIVGGILLIFSLVFPYIYSFFNLTLETMCFVDSLIVDFSLFFLFLLPYLVGPLKVQKKIEAIWVLFLMFIGYFFISQAIVMFVYSVFHLSEISSMLIGNSCFVVALIVFYYKMFSEKIKDYFTNFIGYLRVGVKHWLFGLLVMYVSNFILSYFIFAGEIATNEELNRIYLLKNPIVGFVSVVFLAPFVEEMIFRFGIRNIVSRKKFFPIISALAFGLPHALTGITSPLELLYVVPYGALGYVFAVVYEKTDNIFSSMTVHALHNLFCFVVIILVS